MMSNWMFVHQNQQKTTIMKTIPLEQLLDLLWKEYVETNPPAQHIHDLFVAEGEEVVNDHIAFRTFNHPSISIDVIATIFAELGYTEMKDYHFKQKKLYAKHYEHPNAEMPLIFISELKTEEFDPEVRQIITNMISKVPRDFTDGPTFLAGNRPWTVSYDDYQTLKKSSEYAAWMAAFGFRPNHFTVSVNHLKKFDTLQKVNQLLKNNGFRLNESGGEIKGSPSDYLEQSSTIAYNREVQFSDGKHVVPACYYEFARRYPTASGRLFLGFIAGSADKIFESTNKGQDFTSKGF